MLCLINESYLSHYKARRVKPLGNVHFNGKKRIERRFKKRIHQTRVRNEKSLKFEKFQITLHGVPQSGNVPSKWQVCDNMFSTQNFIFSSIISKDAA